MPKISEKRIKLIYQNILERLPSTYPKAKLIIHKDIKLLIQSYNRNRPNEKKEEKGESPYAFCDSINNTIHVSLAFLEESVLSVIWYFLHEIGHLYALQKYGLKDPRWSQYETAENYANTFANRWLLKFKKESFISRC